MFTRIVTALSIAAAAAATFAAAPAFAAGEATPDYPQVFTSTLSRAEVQQAAIDARRAGLVSQGEISIVAEVTTGPSQITRAQVLAELAEARRLGLVGGGDFLVLPTPEQNERIRLAGLRAAMPMVAAR